MEEEEEEEKILLELSLRELKKSKWLTKKTHFPALQILNIISQKFHGLVLGLVELIDAKGIGVAQLIWL